jgi:hypothetical protein
MAASFDQKPGPKVDWRGRAARRNGLMSEEYKKFRRCSTEIQAEKVKLLSEFEQWLSQQGFDSLTIQRHCEYAESFVSTFLLCQDATAANQQARHIAKFLSYWFIHTEWSVGPRSIKANAATLNQFCSFIEDKGRIDADILLKELNRIIE